MTYATTRYSPGAMPSSVASLDRTASGPSSVSSIDRVIVVFPTVSVVLWLLIDLVMHGRPKCQAVTIDAQHLKAVVA